jgi:hypothetical protein
LWAKAQGIAATAIPDVLRHLQFGIVNHLVKSPLDLVHSYPEEIRAICEEALRKRGEMTSLWFNPGIVSKEAISFAISVLSEVGDATSANVIEALVDDLFFGEDAVRAVRSLRGSHVERLPNS